MIKSIKLHIVLSLIVELNASSSTVGKLSTKPIVSTMRILGLFCILPIVVSNVENN